MIRAALRSKLADRGPIGFAVDLACGLAAVGVVTVCLAVALIGTTPVAVVLVAREWIGRRAQ